MGGHTLINGGLTVDMRGEAFTHIDRVKIAEGLATVRVGAGATWHELLDALDREGWSIAVMQSNDDFTIGGSISVNCHGWQPKSPPIADTVQYSPCSAPMARSWNVVVTGTLIASCLAPCAEAMDSSELFSKWSCAWVPNQLYKAQVFRSGRQLRGAI